MEDTDAWERAHWKALQNIDGPIGEWRNDLRAALANGSGIAIDDIIPRWDSVLRDKADEVQAESERLNRAMRQLRGGS